MGEPLPFKRPCLSFGLINFTRARDPQMFGTVQAKSFSAPLTHDADVEGAPERFLRASSEHRSDRVVRRKNARLLPSSVMTIYTSFSTGDPSPKCLYIVQLPRHTLTMAIYTHQFE